MLVAAEEKATTVSAAAEGNQLTVACQNQAATVSAKEDAATVSAGCRIGEVSKSEWCSRGYSSDSSP